MSKTRYRGVYRGPGFVKAFFRLSKNGRQRCILYVLKMEIVYL